MLARFDEFELRIVITYAGRPILFNALAPSKTDVVRDPSGAVRLAAVVIRRLASRVESREKDGVTTVALWFEH